MKEQLWQLKSRPNIVGIKAGTSRVKDSETKGVTKFSSSAISIHVTTYGDTVTA